MENNNQLYELDGTEALGSYLQIQPCSDNAPDLSTCSIQWYRVSTEGGKKELISGILFLLKAIFGRKERKVKGKINLKEKKIEVIENKVFFLYVVWYVERKEN